MRQSKFSALAWFYIFCATVGAIVPWYFNIKAMQQYGTVMILKDYFREGTATPLTTSITTDFFVGTLPMLVWMMVEAKRLRMQRWWLLPTTLLVSFAFSYPLFLALREQKKHSPNF